MTKPIGPAAALPKEMVDALRCILKKDGDLRSLALLNTHIDMCARGGDVLKLCISDVRMPNGRIRDAFYIKQQKTDISTLVSLSKYAKSALKAYLATRPDAPASHPLFLSQRGGHLSMRRYQCICKDWEARLRWVGLSLQDGGYFSTHSLRRSKPKFIQEQTGDDYVCMKLFGHRSVRTTQQYLNTSAERAHRIAAQYSF